MSVGLITGESALIIDYALERGATIIATKNRNKKHQTYRGKFHRASGK
jgi:hypothetical protein